MKPPLPRGPYAIADTTMGDPVQTGTALFEAGFLVVQLRAKDWDHVQIFEAARSLATVAAHHQGHLIINDHVEIAATVGARGVHLGLGDGDPVAARKMMGPQSWIGCSIPSLKHLADMPHELAGIDHIGVGPVYPTQTKRTGRPALGLHGLAAICAESPVPVVAIGGIKPAHAPALLAAGAHSWAFLSALTSPLAKAVSDGNVKTLRQWRERQAFFM